MNRDFISFVVPIEKGSKPNAASVRGIAEKSYPGYLNEGAFGWVLLGNYILFYVQRDGSPILSTEMPGILLLATAYKHCVKGRQRKEANELLLIEKGWTEMLRIDAEGIVSYDTFVNASAEERAKLLINDSEISLKKVLKKIKHRKHISAPVFLLIISILLLLLSLLFCYQSQRTVKANERLENIIKLEKNILRQNNEVNKQKAGEQYLYNILLGILNKSAGYTIHNLFIEGSSFRIEVEGPDSFSLLKALEESPEFSSLVLHNTNSVNDTTEQFIISGVYNE
ncbi:MAG: hypothetical protein LBM77_11700 [Spirochaetaceae bacterium]|jgi:hypothetical protein|nr:hypothetical protein [Spirochaetaceae bacterium]